MCLAPGAPLGLTSILHVIALGVLHTHTIIPLLPQWAEAYLSLVHCLALPAGRKVDWMDGTEGDESISKPSKLGGGDC